MDTTNLQIIRESFSRVAWTHKTHEKSAEIEEGKVKKVKWINIILSALTFVLFSAGVIFSEQQIVLYLAVLMSAITLGYNFFLLSFNPEKLAESHRYIAKELWFIREKYVNLIADIINEKISGDKITQKRDQFIHELKVLYKFAPPTTTEAYNKASSALKNNEELTFSDEEINNFLPKELHINQK
jgi:hypothetical protein